ncbi:MAG: nucleotide-binding universal stress UspA family protein [Candidatus Paceibacteria bacterium]|jgi:nucleotide-binding universal stress UspA family protein
MREVTVGVAPDLDSLAPWRYGLVIASGWNAKLRAVLVNDSLSRGAPMLAQGDVLAEWLGRFRQVWTSQADEVVRRLREQAKSRRVELDVVRHEGRVVDKLLEVGKDSSLIIAGRGRSSGVNPGSLGSRGEQLARRCRSALFMSPLEYREPERVIAAYAAKAQGDRVLDLACDLAKALGKELIVLTAGMDLDRIRAIQELARARLSDRDVQVEFEALPGKPESVIPARVGSEDVLVLGPHGRSPIYRMLLGRVTDNVIRAVSGPFVLTAKED